MATMFDAISEWGNLCQAHKNAARGKRGRASAAAFEHQLADELLQLQAELRSQTYRPGAYCNFFIREPKLRRISAAPFRDRVVHHALCQQIEPLFESHFIPHSYANRKGKGTHRAVGQVQAWARRHRYALRGDIVQHFPSIDHALLRAKLARCIHDDSVLWLADQILASGDGVGAPASAPVYFPGDDLLAACRPRGLPIGNLTSQFWSNVFLSDFDWFVQRERGCRAYLRYVDDTQMQVLPTTCGIPWLGFVVYPTHRLLKRRNAVNFTRRLQRNVDAYQAGQITFAELDASVQGWINHVRFGDTWGLREQVFATHPIRAPGR